MARRSRHRQWLGTVAFTILLLGLIAAAIGGSEPAIALWAVISVVALATTFHMLLPGSDFLSIVLANSIGIYACLYFFFLTVNFARASPWAVQAGFVLPLAAFLLGVLWRQKAIAGVVMAKRSHIETDLMRALIWMAPLAAVGIMTFLAPLRDMTQAELDISLIGSMTVIGLTAAVAARDIAIFLLDTGLVFENFFANAGRLVKPAFAFFTCASLVVIMFGCIYTIMDRYADGANFVVRGETHPLSFIEGLYLSIVTLSTVGYGDIVAATPVARLVVALEIFTGLLLLLFGVQAILSAAGRGED